MNIMAAGLLTVVVRARLCDCVFLWRIYLPLFPLVVCLFHGILDRSSTHHVVIG